MYGENKAIGKPEDVSISCVEGYTAVYEEDVAGRVTVPNVVVTETETGEKQKYNVVYKQDKTGLYIQYLMSASDEFISINISTANNDYDQYDDYETIDIKGYAKKAPEDLQIFTNSNKNTVKILYAKDVDPESDTADEWSDYSDDCFAEIQITDENGKELKYFVTYRQDTTKASVSKVEIKENAICYNYVSTYTNKIYEDGNYPNGAEFYPIYVVGDNRTLGDDYTIQLAKGAKLENEVLVGDADWKYQKSPVEFSYTSPSGEYCNVSAQPVKRFTVVSEDGEAERNYILYYAQDVSNALVQGVTAKDNSFARLNSYSYISTLELKNNGDSSESEKEEVRYLAIQGGKESYQEDLYELQFGEGTKVVDSMDVGDENWPYNYVSHAFSLYDEEDNYIGSEDVTPQKRIVVEASNGARVIYLVFYRQYKEDARVLDFTDEENTLYSTEISGYKTTMEKIVNVDEETGNSETEKEDVYPICVVGDNQTLGDTYGLELSQGAKIIATQEVGTENGVRYTSMERSQSYCVDQDSEYQSAMCKATKRVEVQGTSGGVRVYLIYYAQEKSGAQIKGIEDADNVVLYQQNQGSRYLCFDDTDEGKIFTEDYFVVGKNDTLGNGFTLQLPDGAKVVERMEKGGEEWPFSSEMTTRAYVYSTFLELELYGIVTVEAKNGAQRTYGIWYAKGSEADFPATSETE